MAQLHLAFLEMVSKAFWEREGANDNGKYANNFYNFSAALNSSGVTEGTVVANKEFHIRHPTVKPY